MFLEKQAFPLSLNEQAAGSDDVLLWLDEQTADERYEMILSRKKTVIQEGVQRKIIIEFVARNEGHQNIPQVL
jgi:hypothetical protein